MYYLLPLLNVILIAVLIMFMLTQAHPWFRAKTSGKVLKSVALSFWQRVRFHRNSLLALAMGITLGLAGGWLPPRLGLFAAGFALAILVLPMSYTFTTQGIAVGTAIFRPWEEFSHIHRKPSGVILEHSSFFGRLTLFIKPAELDSVLLRINRSFSQDQ